MPDEWSPEPSARLHGYVGSAIVALASEMMVIAFNGMALMTRLRAYRNGQEALTAYDTPYSVCRQYWLPGTDIPNVPASLGTAMLYHCWTIIALSFICIEQYPEHGIIKRWEDFMQWAGPSRSTWYSGFLQITIAWAQGGQSTTFLGNNYVHKVRYIAMWLLMANGVWCMVVIGPAFKWKIRWMRKQIKRPEKAGPAKYKMEVAWRNFESFLKTTHADHMVNGAYVRKLQIMRDGASRAKPPDSPSRSRDH